MHNCQAKREEVKCGASKDHDGNGKKILPCNDECARLERNRRLALALNIDQSSHVDGLDHIPYSADTLNLFAPHVKWGQDQEREFRVFATSAEEKRLRFKPMKAQQRAFIHALAEDFGLDSESMDPEPHRHVMVWKTPRFVAPPNKTLAEALRVRQAQRSVTGSSQVSDNETAPRSTKFASTPKSPYNAFVISNPRFGLTVDELRAELTHLPHSKMEIEFSIDFLLSGEVVLRGNAPNASPENLMQALQNLKSQLIAAISLKGYGNPEICTTDSSLNIIRRESDDAGTDGWSKVAAKKAAPKTAVSSGGFGNSGNNFFSALGGNKVTFTAKPKPKPSKEVVVDDWEAAQAVAEEKERAATSGGSANEEEHEQKHEKDTGALRVTDTETSASFSVHDPAAVGPSDVAPSTTQGHGTHEAVKGRATAVEDSASS